MAIRPAIHPSGLYTPLTDNPLTSGATTVNVTSTTGFPSAGAICIEGETITYTGKTGTSFTGCGRGAHQANGGGAATAHPNVAVWAASTAYAVGSFVRNGDKMYTAKTAGTSAGSGGPTGTGAGITDNTVTWDYVRASAPLVIYGTAGRLRIDAITAVVKASIVDGETFTITDVLGVSKTFEFDTNASWSPSNIRVDISADVTAIQVAARMRTAIANAIASGLYVALTAATTAVVTVTQRKPSASAGGVAESVVNAGFTIATTAGVTPTGDAATLQEEIDAASNGDTITLSAVTDPGGTPANWMITGNFVENFDIYASINGTRAKLPVLASNSVQFLLQMATSPNPPAKRGRCVEINKNLTVVGEGVDGNGVPLTKIRTEKDFDYDAWFVDADYLRATAVAPESAALMQVRAFKYLSKVHAFVPHHNRVTLQQLDFGGAECYIAVFHPFDMSEIHATKGTFKFVHSRLDAKQVYPNFVTGVADVEFENPRRSSITNCKFVGGYLQCAHIQGAGAIDICTNVFDDTLGFAGAGVLLQAQAAPVAQADREWRFHVGDVVDGNKFTMYEGVNGALHVQAAGFNNLLFQSNVIKNNEFLDMLARRNFPFGSGFSIAHIYWSVFNTGTRSNKNQVIGNIFYKSTPCLNYEGLLPVEMHDEIIADNVFINTRVNDAFHVRSTLYPELYLWAAGPKNSFSFIKNDFRESGALGLAGYDQWQGSMVLDSVYNSTIHESGSFPPGLGGVANFVTDLNGFNNRTVGLPASANASGSIQCCAKAFIVDGETFTLTDGRGLSKVFEFDTNGSVSGSNIRIDVTGAVTTVDVAILVAGAIVGSGLDMLVTNPVGTRKVVLTQNQKGQRGVTQILDTVANAEFIVYSFELTTGIGDKVANTSAMPAGCDLIMAAQAQERANYIAAQTEAERVEHAEGVARAAAIGLSDEEAEA